VRLPRFTYHAPNNLEEILEILNTHGKECAILAGGTDLLARMKHRLATPQHLVSLKAVEELSYIRRADSSVKIGARTTLAEILNSALVQANFPALFQAATSIGAPTIQHVRGTIGGNLLQENRCQFYNQSSFFRETREPCRKAGGTVCYAPGTHKGCRSVCQSDCAPALIALDARVTLVKKDGSRTLPLNEFYTGAGMKPRSSEPNELMTEIEIPECASTTGSAYKRLACRSAIDFPVVSAAALVETKKGRIEKGRVAVGALGSGPVLITEVANELEGVEVNDQHAINEAGERAAGVAAAGAVDNMLAPLEYRISMVSVMVTRALKGALGNVS
jgi:4-hydroxybenzoyl-CoA reductase beta subunit